MTTEQFTYWLQGFMEVANPTTLDATQTQIIKDHLALVFDKQTPDRVPGLFDPTIPVPPKQWPANPLTPIPTISDPNQIEPDWWRGKNRVICSTDSYDNLGDNENVTVKRFCSSTTPIDATQLVVQEAAKITESQIRVPKILREPTTKKFRGGLKC